MADEYGIQRGLQNLDPSKPEPLVAWLGYTIKGTFRIYILNHPAQYYVRFPDGRLAQAYHDGRIYVTDSITNALVSVELSLDHKGYYHIERLSTPEQDANVQTNGTGIYVPHHVHDAADITTGELVLARGGLGVDASAFTGYLFVAGGVVVQKKANYAASIAPTVSNDNTEGYSIGSEWVDTVTGTVYKAVDVTTGAAVWSDLSGGGSISVDDGTDTVNPASQVSFDPAFFDVTDAGGGQALVTFIGTGGGGGGGGGITRGVYTQVFRQKLGVDAAEFDTGTIDLSPYEHIKIRLLQARGKHATGGQNIAVAFNGDATDANYVGVGYFAGPGFGDFINDGTADSRDIADISADTAPANYRGNGEWMIGEPGVSGNGFKSIVPTGQFGPQGTGANYILTYGTMWKNTAAITRIEVIGGAGDIATGSILEIYGFKNEDIGGGSVGSSLASDKKSLTSGDVAVSSTSFVDLDSSLDITLATGARRCLVSWNLVVTSTGSQSQVDVEIDGVRKGGAFGLLAASASSINANLSGTFLTDVLAAGSHTFKLMVRVDGATSTYRANTTDNPAIFAVEEQANTEGGGSSASSPALIYDYTLPSDGTFDTNTADDLGNTGISQLYTDLELRISGIGAAGVTGGVEIFFNGDTNTANYDGGRTLINGGSSGGDLNEIGFVGTSGVGLYGSIIADVPGYTLTATHRTLIARSAVDGGGTSPNYWHYGLQYNQAGALTRFQAHCRLAGNFAAGSRLRIYGIP